MYESGYAVMNEPMLHGCGTVGSQFAQMLEGDYRRVCLRATVYSNSRVLTFDPSLSQGYNLARHVLHDIFLVIN